MSVSVATLLVTTGISLVFPAAIGHILDASLHAPGAGLAPGAVAGGLLFLFALQSALIFVRGALLAVSGERMAARLRKELFRSVLSQDAAWFDSQRTGDIANRLSADAAVVQKALSTNVANGLRSAAMVVGGVGALFWLSPSLALLSLCLIPPVALGGMAYGRYLQGQQAAVQAALGRSMQVADEAVANLRTVWSFAAEGAAARAFGGAVDAAYGEARRIGLVAAAFDGAVHMAANLALVAVLGYGGHMVSTGALSAGDLTAFLMYSLYTGFNLGNLSKVYSDLKRASGVAGRIYEIADAPSRIPLAAAPPSVFWAAAAAAAAGSGSLSQGPATEVMRRLDAAAAASDAASGLGGAPRLAPRAVRGHLALRGVGFAYPSRPGTWVLRGLDLQVLPGRSLAVVGASGSGKSTLGALITRLYDPSEGSVELDGADVRRLDPQWLRKQIAVVPQEPALFAASIGDNIRYGCPGASGAEVEEAARQANAHDFIAAFPEGYGTRVGERGAQLSGGAWGRPPRLCPFFFFFLFFFSFFV